MRGNGWRRAGGILAYFAGIVWRYRPSYLAVVALSIAVNAGGPFVNIILPKYIIDELLGARRPGALLAYVCGLVGGNLVVALVRGYRDFGMATAQRFFDEKLGELLAAELVCMEFKETESEDTLGQLQRAKTGVGWYSGGGIAGLASNFVAIVASAIQVVGTGAIVLAFGPTMLLVMVAGAALNTLATVNQQGAVVRYVKELAGINRRFMYYLGLLKDFGCAKDIRLYNGAPLVLDRVDGYIHKDWGLEMRRARLMNLNLAMGVG